MNAIEEIRRLYFKTSRATIERDIARAIDLLKSMKDDDERSKVSVYMQGLNEMRKEFRGRKPKR